MQQIGRPYSVQPYDPEWVQTFEREKEILESIFANINVQIEHVGSTTVEGMWAKPQIDILVIVDDLDIVRERKVLFENEGYLWLGDYVGNGEEYIVRDAPSGERLVSVHLMAKNMAGYKSQIILRDYLQKHPKEVEAYSKLKKEIFDDGRTDRFEYGKGKKKFMAELKDRAHTWAKEK